jgi:N-methylhydantoinase A
LEQSTYRLGCDIGGTFTDFVLVNNKTGEFYTNKCLTTPLDPSDAIEQGVKEIAKRLPGFMDNVEEIIHGTTLVINAIIERKGAKTGLITTKGFRDILELGRERRYDAYDIFSEYPEPIVPRTDRTEIDERMKFDGTILKDVDEKEALAILDQFKKDGIKSIAVCFINSYGNPLNEKKIKELLEKEAPEIFLSASFEVLPEIKEYERTCTTAVNAYVKPITYWYLNKLVNRLGAIGFGGKLFIMLSSGGITSVDTAKQFPVRIIESGPTAAVIASQHYGKMFDIKDMFCFDMGGTTAKSCLIQDGHAGLVSTFEVDRVQRFKKGSGLPIQVPVVDLMEIGAGGGSIAKISNLGLLQVGPESAGADPGPACYKLGGDNPTVTDADLVLGYLDPDFFLGGTMDLYIELSKKAIQDKIATPLGTTMVEAAFGIHDLINETMASAAKTHIAEKGGNPNLITISAFGGAGPVHTYGLSKKIGASAILVPPLAGVGSALGFFTAPVAFDMSRSHRVVIEEADFNAIETLFNELESESAKTLEGDQKQKGDKILFQRTLLMRFVGQGAEIDLAVSNQDFNDFSKQEIRSMFHEEYKRLYGRTSKGSPIEFVTFKIRASLPKKPFSISKLTNKNIDIQTCIKGQRKAFSVIKKEYIPFTVYDRSKLFANAAFSGPAIIEERESTIVIGEDTNARVDDFGFIWIKIDPKNESAPSRKDK